VEAGRGRRRPAGVPGVRGRMRPVRRTPYVVGEVSEAGRGGGGRARPPVWCLVGGGGSLVEACNTPCYGCPNDHHYCLNHASNPLVNQVLIKIKEILFIFNSNLQSKSRKFLV
jgi:hypothetical protein